LPILKRSMKLCALVGSMEFVRVSMTTAIRSALHRAEQRAFGVWSMFDTLKGCRKKDECSLLGWLRSMRGIRNEPEFMLLKIGRASFQGNLKKSLAQTRKHGSSS